MELCSHEWTYHLQFFLYALHVHIHIYIGTLNRNGYSQRQIGGIVSVRVGVLDYN